MAARNTKFTFKRGEVGKRMRFRLEDASGPVDLTAYTITLNAGGAGQDLAITAAAVTKETQSGATLGYCYHDLDATTANVAAGLYRAELKLANGANVLYWPVDAGGDRTYFTIEVQRPLDE